MKGECVGSVPRPGVTPPLGPGASRDGELEVGEAESLDEIAIKHK